jgi:hypothetical protein
MQILIKGSAGSGLGNQTKYGENENYENQGAELVEAGG